MSKLSEKAELAEILKEIADDAPARKAREAAELAEIVKKWRSAADLTTSRAGQILGLSGRTIENIEQGRGFGHSKLLILAIHSFGE